MFPEKYYIYCEAKDCKNCRKDERYDMLICDRKEGFVSMNEKGQCDFYERDKEE